MQLLPTTKKKSKNRVAPRPPVKSLSLTNKLHKLLALGVSAKAVDALLRQLRKDHLEVTRSSKRRGRARGGGQSSKSKGRKAVQDVQNLLLGHFFNLAEDDIFVKATSQGGCDLHMSPAARAHFPFAIEVKCVESLNIWKALAQASVNAIPKKDPFVVFFKRAHSPMYVAMRADAFLDLLPKS